MSHSFSRDLRLRVLEVVSEGPSTRQGAQRFGRGGWASENIGEAFDVVG